MWLKCNAKTWRHECGAIISNETYLAHGMTFKHIYRYKSQSDYDRGIVLKKYNSIKEAKNDTFKEN